MQASSDTANLVAILQGMREVSWSVEDRTRDHFGDPFERLTDAKCRSIADEISAGMVGGFVLFQYGMALVWTKVGGKLRFELSAQGEHYAAIICAVQEYFLRERLSA